jgi:hypothetical protein
MPVSSGLQMAGEQEHCRARTRPIYDLPTSLVFFLQNVLQLHQQRWMILRVDSLALWKIINKGSSAIPLTILLHHSGPNRALGTFVVVFTPHTIRHTYTTGRTPLNEWSARLRDRCLHNTQQTNINAISEIRTSDSSNQEAREPRIRPLGQADRLVFDGLLVIFAKPYVSSCLRHSITGIRCLFLEWLGKNRQHTRQNVLHSFQKRKQLPSLWIYSL